MGRNENLHAAKRAKNDEFYTQLRDIENEIGAYVLHDADVFRGKVVLLPCDDPLESNFVKYFAMKFEKYGIKKVVATSYFNSPIAVKYRESLPYMLQFTNMPKDVRTDAAHLDCPKGLNYYIQNLPGNSLNKLEGNGDFRSEVVCRLRDEADVIVTNPPFSLFREFLAWVEPERRKFICIGNMNAITYKEVFPLIKDGTVWLGSTHVKEFMQPGGGTKKFGNVCWFTNIDHALRHEPLRLDTMANNLRYNRKLKRKLESAYGLREYPRYDNYDAIEVPFVECIPSDYGGVMGVPITFLDKWCPEQFEIVAFRKGNDGNDLVFTTERERVQPYFRILVRRRYLG